MNKYENEYAMDTPTILTHIKNMQPKLKGHPRTLLHPLAALMEECGELSTEIQISMKLKDKEPGSDGIIGESVDAILCLLDIIVVNQPDISYDKILSIMNNKMQKWERKYATNEEQDYMYMH